MEVYADNLFRSLRASAQINVELFRPKDINFPFVGKYITYWCYYPLIARKKSGQINHILDHSTSHLIKSFAPESTVITCHDLVGLELPQSCPFWKRKFFYKSIVKNICRARRVIAVSQRTKKDILKYSTLRSEDITVIYYGVSANFKKLQKDKLQSRFRFDKPVILHVGHANFYKNVEGLLKATAGLDKPIKFVKVGPISARQFRLLKTLKIDFVQFPYLDQKDLVQVYNAADLLVYPSWSESFAFPVLEAMACGCPVVCSDAGALPEIAGDAAIKVPPQDTYAIKKAINRVLDSDTLRQELAEKGFKRAQEFSWERAAYQTLEVYRKII